MNIVRCDASHREAWDAFVQTCPRGSFYHRWDWRAINERWLGCPSCYLAAIEHDRIVGVFPLVHVKSLLFGNIACSLPFVNYGGPAADTDAIEAALIEAATDVIAEWRADYLEIRSLRDLGAQYPCSRQKVSMTVDLAPDPDTLFRAYRSDHRQEIRRGYKFGFTARFGTTEVFDDFYTILCESWRDLGTPIYRREYLASVISTFPTDTRICVLYAGDGTPAAAALSGQHSGVVEGLWLGTRSQYRRQSIGYVLYWELIKDACTQGHRLYHLGRSTADSGSEQFKKKWNASPTQLYWQYVLRTQQDIPQLNVRNPKYRLAIATWRRLPVGVTRHIGPFLARSIP